MRKTRWTVLLSVVSIFGISAHASFENASLQTEKSRDSKWIEDVEVLVKELPSRHKDLFFNRSEIDFKNDIETLTKDIPGLKDWEIRFRIAQIVASIGDAHTGVFLRMTVGIPLSLYWFKEGLFVINTIEEYRDVLFSRIIKINGYPIKDVIDRIKSIISHENEAQIRKSMPYHLVLADVLAAAKITDSMDRAMFLFENTQGELFEINISSLKDLRQFKPIAKEPDPKRLPLYRKYSKEIYKYELLDETDTMYLLYNSCRQKKDKPFREFINEMFSIIDQNHVKRIIIDLRDNGGGNSKIFSPFLQEIKKRPHLARKKSLFVILGRNTFSSAVLNALQLQNQTGATFVGEPTGGKPNHFGEVKSFKLPNSKLNISYSTKYFTMSKTDTDSFYPDVTISLSVKDYLDNHDPVLAWILKN